MSQKNFDNELEDLLLGISKIQELGDSVRSKNYPNSHNSATDQLTFTKTSKHLNLAEVTRQSMRPEAAVWLGFAALISASSQHSSETRRLASKLGGHLARRRARPLGSKFGEFEDITISPRCRKVVGLLLELGCEITDVFGVWLRMKSYIPAEEVKNSCGCIWPAINCVEKDNETSILIPRFPERMPLVINENSTIGKYAKISEDGELSFVFWMDEGIIDLEDVCGVAWLKEGLFPLISRE
jgi:hypothetical protein